MAKDDKRIHFASMQIPINVVQPWAQKRAKRRCNDEFKTARISGHIEEKTSVMHPSAPQADAEMDA